MEPHELLEHHGLSALGFQTSPQGHTNHVYLTDTHVLRVSRPELAEYLDHVREARLALGALEVGVSTAVPVAWSTTYSIWERLPGAVLGSAEAYSAAVWSALLDDLERLQAHPLEPKSEKAPYTWTGDTTLIAKADAASWTLAERALLTDLLVTPHPVGDSVFIHGDAYADNVLVDSNGGYTGLIDWTHARWGPLEAECAVLEDEALDLALSRWTGRLDASLLLKMRLNLLLEVAGYGRVSFDRVRLVMDQLSVAKP